MASSSSSHQRNQEFNAFSGIEPAGKRRKACESSRLFDVFINHRGPDVKQTLATQLYNSLAQLGIRVFLDSEEKVLGNSFPSTIETAIRSALVHIAIFSKRYAESAWCLAELVLMLQSEAKIIPVFYGVELRHIEKGVYAEAFINYEDKGRYLEKLNEWKEALHSVSFIAGEEFNSDCKNIVAAVQKEVQRKQYLHVAKYPVGLDNLVKDFERRCIDELVQDFESQCGMKKGKDKAMVVGIFGMGGAGKTTLAKELFNRKSSDYFRASFLFDVREASVKGQLSSLQLKLLRDLFDCHHLSFTSAEEGISYLIDGLRRSPLLNFLIVVDDIDHVEQLNALLIMDILNESGNTLVIVTTRDAGVLINAGITVAYYLKGINRKDGRELFCWHAFGEPNPRSGYETLVDAFVDVCRGLPLSLVVLGRHVHGRDRMFWESGLTKARNTLPQDVKQRLRISFDALDDEEKQVFMDTACFFGGIPKSIAEGVWQGSGWNAGHALEILKGKCLVEETEKFSLLTDQVEIVLRMHDHLRDLGREMAAELNPPHRLWRPQDLEYLESMGFETILATTNIRCLHSSFDKLTGSVVTFFLGKSNICVETSASLIWLRLEFDGNLTEQPSIPSWICLQNLQCLQIKCGRLKTLWENRIQALSQLKELQIFKTSLSEFPGFLRISDSLENVFLENGGNFISDKASMSDLEKLEISGDNFLSKFSISGIHYPSLQSIKLHDMENLLEVNLTRLKTLNCLEIAYCTELQRLTGTFDQTNLVLLNISQCPNLEEFAYLCLRGMMCLENLIFYRSVKVKHFELDGCQNLKALKFDCEKLVELSIRDCPKLEELAGFRGPCCLEKIIIDGCGKLKYLKLNNCQNLKSVSVKPFPAGLVELEISDCGKLEFEYLCFSGMKCLEKITFDRNVKVKYFELDSCENLKTINFSCEELVELSIRDCPKLEELPDFRGPSSLEKIIIDRCGKLKCLILNSLQNLKSVSGNFELRELYINDCPELDELPNLATVSCMEEIKIEDCEKIQNITLPTTLFSLSVQSCRDLQRVTGTGDLTRLSDLYIKDCPELEELPNLTTVSCMEKIKIEDCEKIQNITLPTTLFNLSVQSCKDWPRVTGSGDLTKLTKLCIVECPELEELPNLSRISCLERIEIRDCEKLQNITLPTTLISLSVHSCPVLQRVAGTGDLTKLKRLEISMCSALEELPSLSRLRCLETFVIDSCEKLENIAGIEELQISESMRLCYCSNAVIQNCIHQLKSVPWRTYMIGRAVDGAESILNEYLFAEAHIGADALTDAVTDEWLELRALIGCFVVVVDSSTSVEDINKSVEEIPVDIRVRQGEWIITIAYAFWWHNDTEIVDVLRRYGIMKKGFRVKVKKGEEWKSLGVLRTIVDRLHY